MASTSSSSSLLRLSALQYNNCNKVHPSGGSFGISFRPRQTPPRTTSLTIVSSRRRNSSTPSLPSKKTNKKNATRKKVEEEEDDIDEDAFEALFRQLEEDLKSDDLLGDDGDEDEEISEEELAKLEQELAAALEEDDELVAAFGSMLNGGVESVDEGEDDDIDGDDDDEEEEEEEEAEEDESLKLKNWQLKRLAYALKDGRRKTSIKNLAADLCLDRVIVLQLLRDPPPNLVLMSAALPDKPISKSLDSVEEPLETVPLEATTHAVEPEVETKVPVHVMQSSWSARKRLKKVQIQTLEQVYKRTKRPTNAMISSIVHVTNLPRRRVLKWFEDKRAVDGVPEDRRPYQRSVSESVFTS